MSWVSRLLCRSEVTRSCPAYEFSRKLAWWNKAVDCGPIVEQATHFCDLSRYFGGEVDLKTVMAHSLEWYETPGQLSKVRAMSQI